MRAAAGRGSGEVQPRARSGETPGKPQQRYTNTVRQDMKEAAREHLEESPKPVNHQDTQKLLGRICGPL